MAIRKEVRMMGVKRWLLGIIIGLCSLGLGSMTGQAATVVHDQAHLLTAQQREQIRTTNADWATSRHHPQLWVYTYRHLPGDGFLSGYDYSDPFKTPGNDLADRLRHREAQRTAPVYQSTGDREYAVTSRQTRLEKHVSVIVVYPDNGWHTIISPSDDLTSSISDLQRWWITSRLPNKQGTGKSAMKFFNRYAHYIDHHVANVKKIKPGMSGDLLTFLILTPLLLCGVIWFFHDFHGTLRTIADHPSNDYYGAWTSYMFGRWIGGDHDDHDDYW